MKKIFYIFGIIALIVLISGYIQLNDTETNDKLETGPETSCNSDDDCYCRQFDGTKFLEGKSSSKCCTEEFAPSLQQYCPQIDHCMQCVYR